MKKKMRIGAVLTALCLVAGLLPMGALAAEEPTHSDACGYVCTHSHDERCGYAAAADAVECPNAECAGDEEGHVAPVGVVGGAACNHTCAAEEWFCAENCPITVLEDPNTSVTIPEDADTSTTAPEDADMSGLAPVARTAAELTAPEQFIALVNALPEPGALTLDDAEQVAAAVNAYSALSRIDKKEVPADVLQKLVDLDAAIAALAWADVPETLDGGVLDLSGKADFPDAGGKVIAVSGAATIIGFGDSNRLGGLQVVLADGAELTLQDLNLYDYTNAVLPRVTVEDGAGAALHSTGNGNALFSRGTNPAVLVGEGASLTIDGDTKLTMGGPIAGEKLNLNATLQLNPGKNLNVKDLTVLGGSVNGGDAEAGVTGGTVSIDGGEVSFSAIKADTLRVTNGSFAMGEYGSVLTCDLTVSGGVVSLAKGVKNANTTITGGLVNAQARNGYPAIESGTLTLTDGALVALDPYANNTAATVSVENLTIGAKAAFTALNNGKNTAVQVSGPSDIEQVLLRGSLAAGQTAYNFKINGGRTVYTQNSSGFAVTVPAAESYTMTHQLGLYTVKTPLMADQLNSGLVWTQGAAPEQFYVEGGDIVVSVDVRGGYQVKYGDVICWLAQGEALEISQDDPAVPSASYIEVKSDVTGLTLKLTGLNLSAATQRSTPVTISGTDIAVELVGTTSISASYANPLRLTEGATVTLTGDTLKAIGDGVEYAAIGVPKGAALTIDGATVTAIGGGAGIGSNSNHGNTDADGDAGEITITNGAAVTAKGGNFSAAIGGGQYSNGGNLTITGEGTTVYAHGGGQAAGIGGGTANPVSGMGGESGTVHVGAGTTVTAIGAGGAAGIGRGQDGGGKAPSIALEDGFLTIEAGATVTAYAPGTRFAIDANQGGNTVVGGAKVLNARFLEGVLTEQDGIDAINPIRVVSGETGADLALPAATPYRSFAATLSDAGDYMVQNAARGKTAQRAEYQLQGTDSPFLFSVGDGMTTRDELRFATYTITATAGSNGSISDPGETVLSPLDGKRYTVTPTEGYVVDTVTVDGKAVTLSEGVYAFEKVTADHTIAVTFKTAPVTPPVDPGTPGVSSYKLTVNYLGSAGESLSAAYTARRNEGTSYDLTEQASKTIEGYKLDHVEGDALTGTVKSAVTVNVYYAPVGGETDIPEEDTPLTDLPETEIPEEETPLTDLPGTGETQEPDGEGVTIVEPEVPMGNLPQTGSVNPALTLGALALAASLALAGAAAGLKKKED